jgi:anti-sigma factor RsiW
MNNLLHRLRFLRDHRWAPGQMSANLEGELGSGARARLERHVAECSECHRILWSLRRMLGLLGGLDSPQGRAHAQLIVAAVRARLHEPP